MADKSLFICQSCYNSLSGCMIWKFVDTNDYFGCPSYSPFEILEEPDPPDSPFPDVPDVPDVPGRVADWDPDHLSF